MDRHYQKDGPHSPSEEESRRIAEASRETTWEKASFLRELFLGKLRLDLVHPFPDLQGLDNPDFKRFYNDMKKFLQQEVDSDAIDRNRKIPRHNIERLAEMGAFGMKIDKKYGGLGFTQAEYNEILKLITSQDGNLTALLSAHQSIGVPQPLMLFGTEEQKQKYLPRIAKGAVTAFALTEPDVGSDPARVSTNVEESADGKSYILNGEKLWTTNGTIADLLVVMARHKEDGKISAFIVDTEWEGVEVVYRCSFMGLKALENGLIRFTDVRIPKEDLLWQRGKGLKLALVTLNTGRLALPAATVGAAKTALEICRLWGNQRVQWGQPVGKHEAIAHKIADMAAATFAMESIADLATAMAENDFDIRLEAAVAKMYNTEAGWKIIDDAVQIRGGRGYETAESMEARGEPGVEVERMMRDFRINLIFEGSSEIMRLFIAREAVDKHLEISGIMLDPKKSVSDKMAALPRIFGFYAKWYPSLWLKWGLWPRYRQFGKLAGHMRFAERSARKLARQIFHAMLVYQGKLEKKQAFLFRLVDIGAELFAMTATISRAMKLSKSGNTNAIELADAFCRSAQRRVNAHFISLWSNDDVTKYKLARQVLDDDFLWLEEGSVGIKEKELLKRTPEKRVRRVRTRSRKVREALELLNGDTEN